MAIHEIELHPGHWHHPGSGANGILNEVTEARKVTRRVYDILKAAGVPCTYFEDNTSTNQNQNLGTLVKHHNADRDGLVVSIHFNSSGGIQNKAIGTEVLYYDQKELAEKISKAIYDATGGGLQNRGAKQNKGLAVLAQTYEPAVLIEVCFVNSTVDAAIYRRDFEKICQAIAKVLAAHIGYTIDAKVQTAAKEEDNLNQPLTPANKAIDEAIKGVLIEFEQHGLSNQWRQRYERGELNLNDAVGILFVALDRGYILRK